MILAKSPPEESTGPPYNYSSDANRGYPKQNKRQFNQETEEDISPVREPLREIMQGVPGREGWCPMNCRQTRRIHVQIERDA